MPRRKFSLTERRRIIEEAYSKPENIRPTARLHNVYPAQIRRWRRALREAQDRGTPLRRNQSRVILSPRAPIDSDIYPQMIEFYRGLRDAKQRVTTRCLVIKAMQLKPSLCRLPRKTLEHRIYRWLHRSNISQRRRTHVAQNTRANARESAAWVKYVNEQIATFQFDPQLVVNMDETNIYFDNVGNLTWADKGSRTVSVSSTGSKQRCTIALAVTLGGLKLKPLVIFKGKPNGRIRREARLMPENIVVAVNEKTWMSQEVMKLWIEKVWAEYCRMEESYLLLDEYQVHKMSWVMKTFAAMNTEVDFVLAGRTGELQVLDVGINKPFKDYVQRRYDDFIINKEPRERVTRLKMTKWIDEAWKEIKEDTIFNTWTKIGIIPP